MTRYERRMAVVLGGVATFGIGYGCAFNPFAPPDFDERPGAGQNDALSSSSAGGAGSQGGMGGLGGSSGQGGTGGAPCMCTNDSNECTTDLSTSMECPDGDETKCHTIVTDEPCSAGWCNDKGECKDCKTCITAGTCDTERCDGIACNADSQCKNGHCEQKTCCDLQCDGPCKACDRPGKEGTCTNLPFGLQVAGCDAMGRACDIAGSCGYITKAALGALCSLGTDCATGQCKGETCRSQNGQPCIEDLECFSNRCDPATRTCKACTEAGVGCGEGAACIQQNGACQVLLGQPAQTSGECSEGTVFNFLCSLEPGESCMAHSDCKSRNCLTTNVCAPLCSQTSDCLAGTSCFNGACKLLTGSYCVVKEQCESGKCGGFPPKCQP